MVWGGVSGYGKTKLHLFLRRAPTRRNPNKEVCVSVDSPVYQSMLAKRLLPDSKRIFKKKSWWFQQDGAPSHKSRSTIAFMEQLFTGRAHFLRPSRWPPCSPDLTPLDYRIWALMLIRMGKRVGINILNLLFP